MLYPRNADEWGLPSGGREGDDTFGEAAVRKVNEETGIHCEITDLWLLRHHVWQSADETIPGKRTRCTSSSTPTTRVGVFRSNSWNRMVLRDSLNYWSE